MKISVATEMAKAAELEHCERSGSWEMIFLTRATEKLSQGNGEGVKCLRGNVEVPVISSGGAMGALL